MHICAWLVDLVQNNNRLEPQLDETDLLTPRQLGLSAAVIRPLVENLKQYGKVWLMTARELPPALDYAHAG
jgi:hypothetical protein